MTRLQVKFQVEGQAQPAEIELQVDASDISGDMVLRALGKHLNPSEEWPFAVEQPSKLEAGLTERAVRLCRMQAARRYLRLQHLTYRPEGRILELVL